MGVVRGPCSIMIVDNTPYYNRMKLSVIKSVEDSLRARADKTDPKAPAKGGWHSHVTA